MSGSLNEGNLFDGLQLVDYKSFVGFIKDQLGSPCNSNAELNEYSVASVLTNIPIATYRLQLATKYPSKSQENPLLFYDPKEMEIFGEDLKKRLMEELKVIMNLQERFIQGILEASLMKNKGLLRFSQILKIFEDELQKCLEGSDCGSDADLLKLHEDLKVRALSSLPKKEELEGCEGRENEGLLLELKEVLESEIDKRKPVPEEVWRRKAEGIIEDIKANHRECLEFAKEENLDQAQRKFREIALIVLDAKNPFPSNSEWKRKLEERVNEELEAVLAEVRNQRQKSVRNLGSGSEPIIPEIEVKEEIEVEDETLLIRVSNVRSISKAEAQQTLDGVVEVAGVKTYPSKTLSLNVTVKEEEFGAEFLKPQDHEMEVEMESREGLGNESRSHDVSDDAPLTTQESRTRKDEGTSEAGESSQVPKQSKSAKSKGKRAHKAKLYYNRASWDNRCPDCRYCPPAAKIGGSMFSHKVRHHLEKHFPASKHKETFLTDIQYKMVLYHLLFENVVTKGNSTPKKWQCTICLKAGLTISNDQWGVQEHAVKKHFTCIAKRLKEVQNDPGLEKKLKQFENEGELCPCGVYMTKVKRAAEPGYKYHLKLCKLNNRKWPESVSEEHSD